MRLLRIIGVLILIGSAGFAQDFDKGLDAAKAGDFDTAMKELKPLADNGHPRAQYIFGFANYHGNGVSQDFAEAARWYLLAAEQGHLGAQIALGTLYEVGEGVPESAQEAFRWYGLAAEQGDEVAQFNLGFFYQRGLGVQQDLAEAARWYRLSAEQDVDVAQYQLGYMYDNGSGVAQDYGEAVFWYNRAAAQGYVHAQSRLGEMHEVGLAGQSDFAEAMRWYRLAAEQGNRAAQSNLGRMFHFAIGVPEDFVEAAHWYRRAAEQGNEFAQLKMAVFYQEGTGVQQDLAEAARWYRIVAEQGNISAQYLLGNIYREGIGVPIDALEAVHWYLLAAEQGDLGAQSILAYMHYFGQGVAKDRAEGLKWYRLAADQGSVNAQSTLGFAHFYGEGIKKNYAEAAHWYRLAAEQGDVTAQANLGEIFYEAKGVPHNPEEGLRWYRLAAENGDVDTQTILGFEHYYGKDVPQDLEEAARWYRLAAEQGDAKAQSKLGFMYRYGMGVQKNVEKAEHWYRLAAEQGRSEEPEQIIKDARDEIAQLERQFGFKSLGELYPLMTIGDVYNSELGFLEDAIVAYQQGFDLSKDVLGENHETTLDFMSKLASCWHNLGTFNTSVELRRELVSRSKRVRGPADKLTLNRMGGLSTTLTALGLDVEANKVMQEGLQVAKSVHGEDAFIVTGKLGTLALTTNFGEPSEGQIDTLTVIAEGYKDDYGDHSENVLIIQAELAEAMMGVGRHLASVEVWGEIVEAHEDNLKLSSSFDEEIRGGVIKAAKDVGLSFVEAAWKAHTLRKPSADQISFHGRMVTSDELDYELLNEAFVAVQMGQNKTAHAVARSKAKLSLKQVGLHDLFNAYEAKQKRLRDLGREISNQLSIRSNGNQKNDGKIVFLQESRDRAVVEVQSLGDDLKERFPRFFDVILPQPVSVDELQGRDALIPLLGENEVLILLSPPQNGLRGKVWAVGLEEIAWAEIPQTETELRDNLSRLHSMLDGGGATHVEGTSPSSRGAFSFEETSNPSEQPDFDRSLSHELYLGLLGDPAIQAVVNNKTEWILAPQGMLLSLPFATLVTEAPLGARFGDADPAVLRATSWLGIQRALSVVPAVSSLRVQRRSIKDGSGKADLPFLGLGDPAFDGVARDNREISSVAAENYFRNSVGDPKKIRGLSRLPGTRREIEKLAAVFEAKESSVLLGLDASETQLAKAQHIGNLTRSKVIVLATHGLMAGAFEGLSEPALAMSPPSCGPAIIDVNSPKQSPNALDCGNAIDRAEIDAASLNGGWIDDGLLTASEVTQLDLDADWVILSACDTAAGENQSPDAEGLSGLARAFFYAGARSLLVSHWPVRDDVASLLTPDAVSRSARGKISRSEAFRQAMVALMNDPSADPTGFSFAHPSAWAPFQVTGVESIAQ